MRTEWDNFEEYKADCLDQHLKTIEEIKTKYKLENIFHEDGRVMTVDSYLNETYETYLFSKSF